MSAWAELFDVDAVEVLLRDAARRGVALSYAETLGLLGMTFSRPRMRALCRVLDVIDERAAARDQPELAVLVVRESDRLPGQGWWVHRPDHGGPWTGPEARRYIAEVQRRAFAYWSGSVA